MKNVLQRIIQIVFLALFVVLIITNKIQIWMGLFGISVILSLFFGRFYCGWICPINTIFKLQTFLKKKLKIKGFKYPKFLTKPITRYIVLLLFIGIFIFVMVTGKKLPVLPALLVIAVILTLFFPENLWHKYLCPYGTILRITSSKSLYSLKIIDENCIKCGKCKRVCPADAIDKNDGFTINKEDCILCNDCVRQCPENTIKYKKH